jgi:hypothetical protein
MKNRKAYVGCWLLCMVSIISILQQCKKIYKCRKNGVGTNGALRCRRDYRKRQKNVKIILLDLFADLIIIIKIIDFFVGNIFFMYI